ncbi:hypothetical protein GOODEAATRI_021962 [Goodea atripinnis]|uniref:Uncharacterized protein n=1 Tax=Goodea atripinnis TaxID=208336 RepID=A0ABV0MJT6_9TELE
MGPIPDSELDLLGLETRWTGAQHGFRVLHVVFSCLDQPEEEPERSRCSPRSLTHYRRPALGPTAAGDPQNLNL